MDQSMAMDRMYRYQRYIYDFTRKYYLFGRDSLLRQIDPRPGEQVVEIGCGTARNLRILAARHPQVHFFGVDASEEMLRTARIKLDHGEAGRQTRLARVLAEDLDYRQTFGLSRPFDQAFFSYTLSMIPTWEQALRAALDNLKIGGSLHVVDFGDMNTLPAWTRAGLKRWLAWFGVHHRPELLDYIQTRLPEGTSLVDIHWLPGRYAYRLIIRKHGEI